MTIGRREFLVGAGLSVASGALGRPIRSCLGGRMWGGESVDGPYDAELEYLESTGKEYIDTGLNIDVYTRMGYYIKLNPLERTNLAPATRAFCGYSNYGSRWFGVHYRTTYDQGTTIGLGTTAYISNDLSLTDHVIYVSSIDGVYFDGVDTGVTYNSSVARAGCTFYVFAICARDSSGVNHISPRKCRIYSLKMYDGADVLQDFIPVRFTNALGETEGAMYDRISGELFRNQGAGSFIIGPDK